MAIALVITATSYTAVTHGPNRTVPPMGKHLTHLRNRITFLVGLGYG